MPDSVRVSVFAEPSPTAGVIICASTAPSAGESASSENIEAQSTPGPATADRGGDLLFSARFPGRPRAGTVFAFRRSEVPSLTPREAQKSIEAASSCVPDNEVRPFVKERALALII
jgi:hypothetical protein